MKIATLSKIATRWLLLLSLLLPLAASADGLNGDAGGRLKVVATFSIIADLARNVGADRIELTSLIGPGGDPHAYEPRPADAVALSTAKVVLANGLGLEGFLPRLAMASGAKAPITQLHRGAELLPAPQPHAHHPVAPRGLPDHHHHGAAHDPHAWQSVRNAQVYVANIADAFCAADARGCASYRANAESYRRRLDALDAEIRALIDRIPANRRTVITTHRSFGYFQRGYGIRFQALQGISTESEASAADVAALIRQVRSSRASAIFMENIGNSRLIGQVASETGLKTGGTLYTDALSGPNGPAATYVDMMRHNARTIQAALLDP